MSTLTFKADAVADGAMKSFEHGKGKILIVRTGDEYSAFDAACPHAGADLGTGVLCAGRVVCPWHHGTFDARSGALLEPLATDGLTRYQVHRDGDRYTVDPSETLTAPKPPSLRADEHVVIVGAGGGGFMAAHTLRQHGFAGKLTVVDPDHDAPYERPTLSKEFLGGEMKASEIGMGGKDWAEKHHIERRFSHATGLDPAARSLTMERGNPLEYDHLIIATGSSPRTGNMQGDALEGVYTLRSLSDAQTLKKAAHGKRVVIVGTSFIGMEVAASLSADKGAASITVIGNVDKVLQPVLGADAAKAMRLLHESHGVTFRLGHGVKRLTGDDHVDGVELDDGSHVDADIVLLGIGVTPRSKLLEAFTDDDGAVPVDARMRVDGDGNIYAVGDIALAPTVLGPQRIEHWRVAMQQGMVAALAILELPGAPMDRRVPFFWTRQFGKSLRYVGHAPKDAPRHVWGDPAKLDFIEFSFDGARTVAAAGMQRDTAMDALELLMELGRAPTAEQVRAGEFDLEALLTGASVHATKGDGGN